MTENKPKTSPLMPILFHTCRYLRNPEALGVTVIGPENEAIKSDKEWIISGRENCCQLPII